MAIFNMVGCGGSSLNYAVVGGTSRPGGGDTLVWDGNTEGLVSVEAIGACKISDAIVKMSDLSNGITLSFIVPNENTIYSTEELAAFEAATGIAAVEASMGGVFFVAGEAVGVDLGGFSFPESGVYAVPVEFGYSLTIPNYTGFGGGASVKENTIWVDTDVKITSHVFSATQPENPDDGMVWFQTGMSSNAAFNALKKNSIEVYPTGCKQYVVDAWVAKTAKTYMNGKWVDWWNGELYDGGNEYSAQTGGWIISGTGSKESNYIIVGATSDISPSTNYAQFNNCVDLRAYSTLKLNFIALESSSSTGRIYVYLYNATGEKISSHTILSGSKSESNVIKPIDISSIEEPISIQVVTYHQNEKRTVYAKFNQIWAE